MGSMRACVSLGCWFRSVSAESLRTFVSPINLGRHAMGAFVRDWENGGTLGSAHGVE